MTTASLSAPEQLSAAEQLDRDAILSLIEQMSATRHEKNAPAVAALYAPGAPIFNLAPPLVHDGIDVAETQAWLDSWEGPVRIASQDFRITLAGDSAFCYGYMRMTGKKKGADHGVDFWMRETLCLARQGGRWRIVHEHTSVPFYMDATLRPAFDLRPEGSGAVGLGVSGR